MKLYSKIKKRFYEILDKAEPGDKTSRIFDIFIMTLIILNIISVVLETEKGIYSCWETQFYYFELISIIIFSIEYILRIWSCTSNPIYNGRFKGRIKFFFSGMALIDLFAILPFYIPMVIPIDLRFIRILRLFRMFRLFKMGRYSKSFEIVKAVIKDKKEELIIALIFTLILLFLSSSVMYFVENTAQPDKFSSILDSMWWGMSTLTTVGYGDVYPVTPLGKFLGMIISILGIGVFALPTGILASGFSEEIKKHKQRKFNSEEEK
ncbi:MAG: potassium channel protein [Desulfuromonas sp. SDB]|nr:MAG: potassium channel protein [Desulfuromonas sp. SDB]